MSLKKKNTSHFLAGSSHKNWKGGMFKNTQGYIELYIGKKKYKKQHVLIIEEQIGRELVKGEVVHHINHVRDDNRLENLKLMSASDHARLHNQGVKFSKERRLRSSISRTGKWPKEKHQRWVQSVTKDKILEARKKFKNKYEIANYLGIHIDSLRNREKYYKIFKKSKKYNKKQIVKALRESQTINEAAKKVGIDPKTLKYAMINLMIFYKNIKKRNLWLL